MADEAKHFGDALTWIERNHPNGIALVARALAATSPVLAAPPETPAAGPTFSDGTPIFPMRAPASAPREPLPQEWDMDDPDTRPMFGGTASAPRETPTDNGSNEGGK